MLYINIQIITLENVKNDVKIVECIVVLTSHSPVRYSMITDQLVTLAMNTLQLTVVHYGHTYHTGGYCCEVQIFVML